MYDKIEDTASYQHHENVINQDGRIQSEKNRIVRYISVSLEHMAG